MLIVIFDIKFVIIIEWVPEDQAGNSMYCREALIRLKETIGMRPDCGLTGNDFCTRTKPYPKKSYKQTSPCLCSIFLRIR